MELLDGTLIVRIGGDHPAARAVGEHGLASRFERGITLRTADGTVLATRRPPGYPPLLPHDDEVEDGWHAAALGRCLVAAVRHPCPGAAGRGAARASASTSRALPSLTTLTGSTDHGRWWVQQVAIIPPVDTRGLVVARPAFGATSLHRVRRSRCAGGSLWTSWSSRAASRRQRHPRCPHTPPRWTVPPASTPRWCVTGSRPSSRTIPS